MSKQDRQISRVRRSRQEAKRAYDRYSRWYDWIGGQFERKYAYAGVQLLQVKPGARVLEIGYGTGHVLVLLAQLVGPTGEVYGIDISKGMYDVALQRIRKKSVASRVHVFCGDALDLPFSSAFFDVVYMSFTLELFDTPEIPLLLEQCRRVLRKGGKLGVVALSKKSVENKLIRIYEWLHHYFPTWVDCRPIFLSQCLGENGFQVLREHLSSMFGLKIELVVGKNP